MLQRISFLFILSSLLAGLAFWSRHLEAVSAPQGEVRAQVHRQSEQTLQLQSSRRREVVEVLDRVVAFQHYYRSVYGHFTKLLNRIGYTIPPGVLSAYDIRVAEASSERLLITAISEIDGRAADVISIDQDFEVRSNISLPMPRPEYLRAQALKHLRTLREAPAGQGAEEQGVYRGFFRFEVRKDSQDRRIAFAVGVRPPVVGLQLEQGEGEGDSALPMDFAEVPVSEAPATGQRSVGNVMSSMEEELLAQRIFLGEVGRYARTWSELTKIAHFKGAGRDEQEPETAEETDRKPGSSAEISAQGLEIEPIPLSENH